MTAKHYALVEYGDPEDQHVHVVGTVASRDAVLNLAQHWADDHLHPQDNRKVTYLGKDPLRP